MAINAINEGQRSWTDSWRQRPWPPYNAATTSLAIKKIQLRVISRTISLESGVRLLSVAEERINHMFWLPHSHLVGKVNIPFFKVWRLILFSWRAISTTGPLCRPSTVIDLYGIEKVQSCKFGQMRFTYFKIIKEP